MLLTVGQKAPAFSGKDQNGDTHRLSQYKGQKVVLYFYPQDMTPTCTVQACNLRDHFGLLRKEGWVVIGVSPDTVEDHKQFETKHDLPFPLIADPEHKIINTYGVWGEKQLYGRKYMGLFRTTYLIDEHGVIRHVFARPKSKQQAEDILAVWRKINS